MTKLKKNYKDQLGSTNGVTMCLEHYRQYKNKQTINRVLSLSSSSTFQQVQFSAFHGLKYLNPF